MNAIEIVNILLSSDDAPTARRLIEVSVYLPRRGRRWIATYRDGSGRQFWRSTGHTDRQAAFIVAQKLEQEARRTRAAQGELGKAVVRARPDSSGLTQQEVALVMGMSERGVRAVERRALEKLRRHPALRGIWREWIGEGAVSAEDGELTDAEVAAIYGLARTREEQRAVEKMMALMSGPSLGLTGARARSR